MSANTPAQWSQNNTSVSGGVIYFNPTKLDWGCNLTANNLNFKYGGVKNGKVHVKFDWTATGCVSGSSINIAACTWNTKNPTKTSTRDSYGPLCTTINPPVSTAVSGHVDEITAVVDTFGGGTLPPRDDYYFGVRFYAYTGRGSAVTISNLVIEVTP